MKYKPWYVYIVKCKNGNYYTGISTDVEERVKKHNSGKGSKAIRAFGTPVVLMSKIYIGNKSTALRVEYKIKKASKSDKEYIMSFWPGCFVMCNNKSCPKKLACYRYCSIPSQEQKYFCFEYSNGECGSFIVNKITHKFRDINEGDLSYEIDP